MTMNPGWGAPPTRYSSVPGWVTVDQARLTTVLLGDLPLLTTARQVFDASVGYAIGLRSITGWKGPARDNTDVIPHPSGDGVVSMLQRYGARSISLRGAIQARTPAGAVAGEDALTRFQSGVLRITEAGSAGMREVDVRSVNVDLERRSPEYVEWTVDLTADDPYRYGSAVRPLTNGANSIPNRGNVGINPTLDLVGPHGALTITHPGGVYTLSALAAGQRRTLDWRNGDVWADNLRVFGTEGGRRPIVLRGGSGWTVAGLGSGSATLRRYEAWT